MRLISLMSPHPAYCGSRYCRRSGSHAVSLHNQCSIASLGPLHLGPDCLATARGET